MNNSNNSNCKNINELLFNKKKKIEGNLKNENENEDILNLNYILDSIYENRKKSLKKKIKINTKYLNENNKNYLIEYLQDSFQTHLNALEEDLNFFFATHKKK